jgi:ribosomal protein S8
MAIQQAESISKAQRRVYLRDWLAKVQRGIERK